MTCLAADTGPLIALAHLQRLDLPGQILGQLMVPETVYLEATFLPLKPGALAIRAARDNGWLEIVADQPLSDAPIPSLLGEGERQAMALALSMSAPLLMDDAQARRAARRLGLAVAGTCGLLLKAKQHGAVPALAPLLATLDKAGYFIAPALRDAVLKKAGEQS